MGSEVEKNINKLMELEIVKFISLDYWKWQKTNSTYIRQ